MQEKRREEKRKRFEPLIRRIRRVMREETREEMEFWILDFGFWIEEEEKIASRKGRKDAKEGASIHGHPTLRLGGFARDFFLKMEKRGFW